MKQGFRPDYPPVLIFHWHRHWNEAKAITLTWPRLGFLASRPRP